MRALPFVAVLWVALAAALRAEEPAPPPVDPAIAKLVEQLGDYDFRKRDEASHALLAAGPKALPILRQALNHPDAEIRRRANDLLPALETAVVLAPKRVTFKTTNKPVKAAFDELIRQTGYHVEYALNDPNKLYSFDFQDVSFWEAIDKMARATGLVLQQGYADDRVRLNQQNAYAPYVHYEGAFRFAATGFNQFRNIDFGLISSDAPAPPARNDSLTLLFSVYVEPKLGVLGLGEPHLDAAYDNEKNCLLLPVSTADALSNPWAARRWIAGKYGNGSRTYSTQSQVSLVRPSDRATSLKLVRGQVPVTLLVSEKPTVVTDKFLQSKGTRLAVGPTQFNIEDVSETAGKQYQLHMSVTEDLKDNPNDYSWVNSLYQRIELQDAKGGKMPVFGSQWNNTAPNHVEMVLTYGTAGGTPEPPAKLIYYAWETRQELVPFEFKDLPLP